MNGVQGGSNNKYPTRQSTFSQQRYIFIPSFLDLHGRDDVAILKFKTIIVVFFKCIAITIWCQSSTPAHTAKLAQCWIANNCSEFVSKDERPPNSLTSKKFRYKKSHTIVEPPCTPCISAVCDLKLGAKRENGEPLQLSHFVTWFHLRRLTFADFCLFVAGLVSKSSVERQAHETAERSRRAASVLSRPASSSSTSAAAVAGVDD